MEQFKMRTENNIYSSELAPILLKGSPMSSSDGGFCSGSSENGDDILMEHHRRSPTSDDSVEVKILPISLPSKNKRKSTEPLRLVADVDLGPIKKRIRYDEKYNSDIIINNSNHIKKEEIDSKNPFRPWTGPINVDDDENSNYEIPNPAEILVRHPGVTTLHRTIDLDQEQPLALVSKKSASSLSAPSLTTSPMKLSTLSQISPSPSPSASNYEMISNNQPANLNKIENHSSNNNIPLTVPCINLSSSTSSQTSGPSRQSQQRNYKNMTRERRIEANARERTRVHTISAAYDTLRKSIPAYSNTQKLSKLSILRISCQYILLLSRIAGLDYSPDTSEPSLADCMEVLTKTIQTEGKLRKKKDE